MSADAISNALSVAAILFSVIALVITNQQRRRENRLSRRRALTETVSELAKIQIAQLELQLQQKEGTEEGVSIQRVYGLQRRFYARLGARLIEELHDHDEEVTEVDHNLLATAYRESSDPVAAERHWKACVEKSAANSALLAMNLRGTARFYFLQGRFDAGRKHYSESLEVTLPQGYDAFNELRSDTYRMWAREEIDAGHIEEGRRLIQKAKAECSLIKHAGHRRGQQEYIDKLAERLQSAESAG